MLNETDTFFKILGDSTRLRCLMLMQAEGELTHVLILAQPEISRQLAHLRELKLVTDRHEGLWIYYCINPSLPDWIRSALQETIKGIEYQSPFKDDLATLATMPKKSDASRCARS